MSDSVRPHPWDSPGKNIGMGCHFLLRCIKVKNESEVAQSCPTLRDPMDCSLPGSSVHGIFQARVLEWGAIAFSDLIGCLPLITHLSQVHNRYYNLACSCGCRIQSYAEKYTQKYFYFSLVSCPLSIDNQLRYFLIYPSCISLNDTSRYMYAYSIC